MSLCFQDWHFSQCIQNYITNFQLYTINESEEDARRGSCGCADGLWPIQNSSLCDLSPWRLWLALKGQFWLKKQNLFTETVDQEDVISIFNWMSFIFNIGQISTVIHGNISSPFSLIIENQFSNYNHGVIYAELFFATALRENEIQNSSSCCSLT